MISILLIASQYFRYETATVFNQAFENIFKKIKFLFKPYSKRCWAKKKCPFLPNMRAIMCPTIYWVYQRFCMIHPVLDKKENTQRLTNKTHRSENHPILTIMCSIFVTSLANKLDKILYMPYI